MTDKQPRFQPSQIPVTMSSGKNQLRSTAQVNQTDEAGNIIAPDPAEMAHFAQTTRTCGQCRFGDFGERAQEEIKRQQFYQQLVKDMEWKLHHLGSGPQDLGLCGASGGEMMTGRLHRACDQFRENRGLILITNKKKDR